VNGTDDGWGNSPQEYADLLLSLSDDFVGDGRPNIKGPGELGRRLRESMVNHIMLYGHPESLAELAVYTDSIVQGAFAWATLEGYVELQPKALSTEGEQVSVEEVT